MQHKPPEIKICLFNKWPSTFWSRHYLWNLQFIAVAIFYAVLWLLM